MYETLRIAKSKEPINKNEDIIISSTTNHGDFIITLDSVGYITKIELLDINKTIYLSNHMSL